MHSRRRGVYLLALVLLRTLRSSRRHGGDVLPRCLLRRWRGLQPRDRLLLVGLQRWAVRGRALQGSRPVLRHAAGLLFEHLQSEPGLRRSRHGDLLRTGRGLRLLLRRRELRRGGAVLLRVCIFDLSHTAGSLHDHGRLLPRRLFAWSHRNGLHCGLSRRRPELYRGRELLQRRVRHHVADLWAARRVPGGRDALQQQRAVLFRSVLGRVLRAGQLSGAASTWRQLSLPPRAPDANPARQIVTVLLCYRRPQWSRCCLP
jgi:hypothetical protein